VTPPSPATSRAFSLVELLAALTILGVAVLGILDVVAACARNTSTVMGHTRAVLLAREKIEETLAEQAFVTGTDSGTFGPAGPRHAWHREIETTETDGLYEITVTVTWDEQGVEKRYALTTLAAERE